jgi:hypothetical protein
MSAQSLAALTGADVLLDGLAPAADIELPEWGIDPVPQPGDMADAASVDGVCPPLARLGALELWRDELRRGVGGQRIDAPSTWRMDALWRAACREAAALEDAAMGLDESARRQMVRAARELVPGDDEDLEGKGE